MSGSADGKAMTGPYSVASFLRFPLFVCRTLSAGSVWLRRLHRWDPRAQTLGP